MDQRLTPSAAAPEVGRPVEVELRSNLHLIHPLSRALVTRLIPLGVSPNAVSVAGAISAAAAAAAYTLVPRPWGALAGLFCHIVWHVLDGADGDLARRTGKASTHGELVDGVCDYTGRTILYLALAAYGAAQFGAWIWTLAVFVGASRIVQANDYETLRREYRKWVYGTRWLRQDLERGAGGEGTQASPFGGLGRLFLLLSTRVTPESSKVDAALAARAAWAADGLATGRAICKVQTVGAVKRASILSANSETVVIFLSMLAGSPIYLFVYVAVGLNGAYAALYLDQRTRFRAAVEALQAR